MRFTEEQRKQISLSVKNYYASLSTEERLKVSKSHSNAAKKHKFGHWMNGRKLTDETKKIMSAQRKGEKHYRWIEDRTTLTIRQRRKEWTLLILNRDNHKCRISDVNCKGRLETHHILSWGKYPELRFELNNGITLCHFHHPRTQEDVTKLSPYFQELVASTDQD
jgi:hypothetical protein